MSDDRYWTDYSAWGSRFDIDEVLRLAPLHAKHDVWRRGESTEFGLATTSGVSLVVFPGGSELDLARAVRRFLTQERRFLRAVRRIAARSVHHGLGTTLFVPEHQVQPIGVQLPADVIALLGSLGSTWRVGAMPCFPDGHPKLGGRPTKG